MTRKVRTKRMSLEKMRAARERVLAQLDRLEARKIVAAIRLGNASTRYDAISRKHGDKSEELAAKNGLIHEMERRGAVGYVAKNGGIHWWVMPDGTKVDARIDLEGL